MSSTLFSPEDCAHRRNVRGVGQREVACCGILEEIVGGDMRLAEVRRDACVACCGTTRATAKQVNSVLASLLYTRCSELIDSGAAAGFDVESVRDMAVKMIAWEVPEHLGIQDFLAALERRTHISCRDLGERLAGDEPSAPEEAVYECRHPEHTTTTPSGCHACRDWADPDALALSPPVLQSLPSPSGAAHGLRFSEWAVGVTTAPRSRPTLDLCLDTLVRAGWDECWLFADAPVSVARRHRRFPITTRQQNAGAWPNYYLALTELVLRRPTADAYLLVQDDAVFYDRENLREYLERASWPAEEMGAVSLYCSEAYTASEEGWHVLEEPWVWGALAFVFPREAARRFLSDPAVLAHRWKGQYEGLRNIDAVVGEWAARESLRIYFPTPSLVQHIGDVSTLWPAGRAWYKRKADRFAGDGEAGR